MNETKPILTLAFSSMGERVFTLLEYLSTIKLGDKTEVIIVVQKAPSTLQDLYYSADSVPVKVLKTKTTGLSKSRNEAINHCKGRFTWFLDDDIQFDDHHINRIIQLVSKGNNDFYRLQIGCLEDHTKTFKVYKNVQTPSKLNMLQVSSIEIIAKTKFIQDNHLRFNENIGLGTQYPANEENNFLIDAWENGAKFEFVDEVLIRHTCLFEGRLLSSKGIFEIRGATASRLGALALPLLVFWSVKYILKREQPSMILSMVKGFFSGYKKYC
ncbi:glycosyltransferase [Thalassotalea euphylliae]|uniref:glycosyltransferase n=1 Tax=Thalassotalea euphylliae TaxID=1655234 RepID=UPI00363FD50E